MRRMIWTLGERGRVLRGCGLDVLLFYCGEGWILFRAWYVVWLSFRLRVLVYFSSAVEQYRITLVQGAPSFLS
jgi:hypothetical protein